MIAIILSLAAISVSAQTEGPGEWRLRVLPETAVVRAEPSAESQALATLVRDANLVSQEKAGAWFRVVVRPAGGDMVVMGFVAAGDVKVLKFRKEESPGFWPEDTGDFRGSGLSARVSFGGGPLAGNDLSRGVRGRYKSTESGILAGGYAIDTRKYQSLSPAYEAAVDLEYRLSPRISVSLGGGSSRAFAKDTLRYHASDYFDRGLEATGTLYTVPIRLGLVYRMPLGRSFSAYGGAGGVYCRVRFEGRQDNTRAYIGDQIVQSAKTDGFGFFGTLGAELKLTSRASFFLETQGRYARIGGFEGIETWTYAENIVETRVSKQGRLYFIDDPEGLRLSILENPPAGNAREAVLDLRSLTIWGGIRLKF